MIYRKLPVVFLSTIASEKKNSTNSQIASYLLAHLDEMQNIGITEMANKCHVANSSISRFCKDIGLNNFNELKELLLEPNFYFEEQSTQTNIQERVNDYASHIKESIDEVANTINYNQITKLCEDIKNYKKIATFGLLKAQGPAISLQGDLLMQGKQVYSNINYQEQLNYLMEATEEDLIIIFSCTGSYFDYKEVRANHKQLNRPKIWLISGVEKDYPEYIDEVILFKSKLDQGSHPYQLQFVESIIAQELNKSSR